MPAGKLKNAQTAAAHFKSVNGHLKKEFILYGEADIEGIKLLKPERTTSVITGAVEDLASAEMAEPLHLTKKNLYNRSNLAAHPSAELAIVNQNGVFDTLVWTTTPAAIHSALRSGVFESRVIQNPLAKMIARLGEYKREVFERSVEAAIVVKHNQEKLAIVDITQDCIAALQPLHYCINNYDGSSTPKQNLIAMTEKVSDLINQLTAIKQADITQPFAPFYQQMHTNLEQMINSVENYRNQLIWLSNSPRELTADDMKKLMGSYASPFTNPDLSLQHFMQTQLNKIMSTAVAANYTVSGLFQDTSGLNKIIIETQIISEGFSSQNVDYHNPFKAEHAFDFSGSANADGLVTLDLGNFGFSASKKIDLARQAALIERVDSGEPLFSKTDVERGYFGINWRGNPAAPLTWLVNGGKDILGTALDLGYIVVKGATDVVQRLLGNRPAPVEFPSGYSWLLKKDLSEDKFAKLPVNSLLYQESEPPKFPHRSLLERLYSGATAIVSRYLIEPLVSVGSIVADEVWNLKTVRQIMYDSTVGVKPVDETAVGLLLTQRINEMHSNTTSNVVTQESLIDSYNKLASISRVPSYEEIATRFATRKQNMPQAAILPYRLTPDDPGDFVTWAANFSSDLASVFTDEIYRGHPIAGLAFTIAASTAAPMMVPALGHNFVLAAINKNISLPIAKVFIGETSGVMPTISTAILQGKIAYLATDMFNGRNSLMKAGLKALLENPVIASVVAIAAVEFGYVLAHDMNIPMLSEKILDETSKATFPYFELGLAGAKIAAILVESTLNFHKEHDNHDSDHLADIAIDKALPDITDAITKGYMAQHNIADDKDLSEHQKTEITQQIDDYCNGVKNALKQPQLAGQISQMSLTLAKMLNLPAPANFNGVAPMVTDAESQNELQTFLERRERRHQIAQLDPNVLTERDKYIITNYLAQVYPDDPAYVNAVRNRFAQETKSGPLGETFKIIFSYPGALIRGAIAAVRSVGYNAAALFYDTAGNDEAAAIARVTANNVLRPVRELGRKIKNDTGLLIKGVTTLLRTTWSLAGGVLMMPVTGLLSLPTILFSRAAPISIFSGYNKLIFAPGRVSQLLNFGVGSMRDDAGARNLSLATQDMDARYIQSVIVPGGVAAKAGVKAGQRATIVPGGPRMRLTGVELEQEVLAVMSNAFSKRATLKTFVNPEPKSFQELMDNLGKQLAKGEQLEKLYSMVNSKPAFNRDLKAALLEVANKVKVLDANIEDRQHYQDRLVALLQVNRREPVLEFKNAYADFIHFELPKAQPKQAVLAGIYERLHHAQSALRELTPDYDVNKSRADVVTDVIDKHNCLSLQSVREIVRLKKIISTYKKELGDDLKPAQNMLHALEMAHKAARTTAYRLAVYPTVVTSLARLHAVFPNPIIAITPPLPNIVAPLATPIIKVAPKAKSFSQRFGFTHEKRTQVVNQIMPLGELSPAVSPVIPVAPPISLFHSGQSTHTQVLMPNNTEQTLLSDAPVRTAIANFVKNALEQAHCDSSARMILQGMNVCQSVRENGNAADIIKLADHWQAFLGDDFVFAAPIRSHAVIPMGVTYDNENIAAGRDIFAPLTVEPLQENQLRTHFLMVNSLGAQVEKDLAGQYTQKRNGDVTTVTTTRLPPMDAVTQIISINGKTATIPSSEYLLFADKQIQTFINDNGSHTKIDLKGSDENLIAAYVIICEAKGLQYNNTTQFAQDIDLVTAVAHVHELTGTGAGKFIAPLYQVDVSQEYTKLKQELNGSHVSAPIFKAIEKIHLGVNVNKNDLQLMADLVKQVDLSATAVNSRSFHTVRKV